MTTYSQMHRTDKYSQHSSIIWPVWLNGWVFVYELRQHSRYHIDYFPILSKICQFLKLWTIQCDTTFLDLNLMGNQIIQSKIQKSQYFRGYKDFYNMHCKIFIQQKMKIIRNLIRNTCYNLFCVKNIKMTLAEQEITP